MIEHFAFLSLDTLARMREEIKPALKLRDSVDACFQYYQFRGELPSKRDLLVVLKLAMDQDDSVLLKGVDRMGEAPKPENERAYGRLIEKLSATLDEFYSQSKLPLEGA